MPFQPGGTKDFFPLLIPKMYDRHVSCFFALKNLSQESSMKKTMSLCLTPFLLTLFPMAGWAQGKCLDNYKAETAALTEQYRAVDKQIGEPSTKRSAAKTKEEQEALNNEGKSLREQQDSIRKQMDEASKRMS